MSVTDRWVSHGMGCQTKLNSTGASVENLKAVEVPIEWHSGLPIYASESFLNTVADEYGWLGGIGESGRLRCLLPYTILRKATLRMVRFRVETISLGAELDLVEETSFLNSVVDFFRSAGADMIIPSGNTAIFQAYPRAASAAPYGTYLIDLTQPEEILANKIRKTYRQNIRKAVAEGVEIKSGVEYLDTSYSLVSDTLKRSGVVFKSHREFSRMVQALGEYVKVFIAEHKGTIQACMVAPFSEYSAYNCYAGTRPEPVLGAMHMLHWEAIRQFRAIGVKRFDFQGVRIDPEKGSKQEGIANYKRGFGGRLVKGYNWKYPLRPLRAMGYSLGIRLFKGGDIVDQEYHKLPREDGSSLSLAKKS